MASIDCIAVLEPPNTSNYESESSPVWYCAWNATGTILATAHGMPNPCVRLWTLTPTTPVDGNDDGGWTILATLEGVHNRTIRCVEFSPYTAGEGSGMLATASFDGTVGIWEKFAKDDDSQDDDDDTHTPTESWECTAQLEGHESEVKSLSWNATGTLLATCGRDKSVWVWECIQSEPNDYSGEDDTQFECLAVLHGHSADVKSVRFAPSHDLFGDGLDVLLSCSYDDTIRCWAEDDGDWYCHSTLTSGEGPNGGVSVHDSTIWDVAVGGSGVRLVSASDDGHLGIWRCYTSAELRQLEATNEKDDHDVNTDADAAFNSNEGQWKCVGVIRNAHSRPIYSTHVAPPRAGHNRIASVGGDDLLAVYKEVPATGGPNTNGMAGYNPHQPRFAVDVKVEHAHEGDINCVRWNTRDGKVLCTVGDDGVAKLWCYTTG